MSQRSEFLYILRPTRLGMLTEGPTPHETEVLARHVAHLQSLAEQGIALLFGRTQTNDEDTRGLVILAAESLEAARALMESDPAVAGDVMRADLFPYRIVGGALRG